LALAELDAGKSAAGGNNLFLSTRHYSTSCLSLYDHMRNEGFAFDVVDDFNKTFDSHF
jgi:hypothetical protein